MNSSPGGYAHVDIESEIPGRPGLLVELRRLVNQTMPPARIDYTDTSFSQGIRAAAMLGLPTPDGDNPFMLRRMWTFRRLYADGVERLLSINRLDSALVSLLNVAWIGGRAPMPNEIVNASGLQPVGGMSGLFVYRNPRVLPRFFLVRRIWRADEHSSFDMVGRRSFDPSAEAVVEGIPEDRDRLAVSAVTVRSFTPNSIRLAVTVDGPAFLVSSEAMYDGWTATVNGRAQPLLMTNGAFRGLALPAGADEITMTYRPRHFILSIALSAAATLIAAACLRRGTRRLQARAPSVA
jgi:hypothetical protein